MAAGKSKAVPIHSNIRLLVEARPAKDAPGLIVRQGNPVLTTAYRLFWQDIMKRLGMAHVPHKYRHTESPAAQRR